MMRKYIVVLLLNVLYSFGQSNDKFLNFTPSTPDVSALLRFADQPVSLNTGLPEIGVDLYDLKIDNNFSIPFKLNYNAGGIMVDQVATSFGLGWSLNGGGVITRTVKGGPDKYNSGNSIYNEIKRYKTEKFDLYYQYIGQHEPQDLEPDLYCLSMFNMTIKFSYDYKEQKFIQTPLSSVRISPTMNNYGNVVSWKVIDSNGYEYYFGQIDNKTATDTEMGNVTITVGGSSNGSGESYTRSWYLLKIVTPKNQIVNFEYDQTDGYQNVSLVGQFKYYTKNNSGLVGPDNQINPPVFLMSEDLNLKHNIPQTSYAFETKVDTQLKKVTFNDYTVEFLKSAIPRQDLLGSAKSIEFFQVKNQNNLIKKLKFSYSYFSTNATQQLGILIPYTDSLNKRLRLDNVQIINDSNNLNGQYDFTYYSDNLPDRLSNSRDIWGYFNGKSNTELFPSLFYPALNIPMGSANRAVAPDFSKYGTLTEIKYPTGGKTTYEYENNTFSTYMDINVPYSLSGGTGTTEPYYITFAAETSLDENNNVIYENTYTQDLNLSTVTPVEFTIQIEGCQLQGSDCAYNVILIKPNDTSFNPIYLGNGLNGVTLTLQPGAYQLIANRSNFTQNFDFGFLITLKVYPSNTNSNPEGPNEYIGGGLRIKRIKTYDKNDLVLMKEYEYHFFNNNQSSGFCWSPPIFVDPKFDYNGLFITKFYGMANFSFTGLNNNIITYDAVTEKKINFQNNQRYKSEYEYSSNLLQTIFPDATFQLNLNLPNSSWRVSNLLKKRDYKYNGTSDLLIREEKNEYDSFDLYQNDDFGARVEKRETKVLFYPVTYDSFLTEFYSFYTEFFKLKKKIITEYYNNSNELVTTINYDYTNPNRTLTSQITTNSKGEILQTKYQYAHEKANQAMIDANMTEMPLVVQTYKGAQKLSEQETVYAKDATTGNLLLPKTVLASKGAQTSETKVTFNSYDDKGNITQYTPEGGISTAVIWGYNKSLPIAKVENATYAQVQQYVANLQTLSNGTDENALLLALNSLRTNLPSAMITTYTHKPLIGVSTITDPKGFKTTYTYDAFNRLKEVKDHQGNVVKEHSYNYRP